jgi:quercetin dioxygenase-like cupin family protein
MKHLTASEITSNHDLFKTIHRTERTQIAMMTLSAGEVSGELGTDHPDADQIVYVLSGQGCAQVGEQVIRLRDGDVLVIAAGETHQIEGGPIQTLNVYGPPAYANDN